MTLWLRYLHDTSRGLAGGVDPVGPIWYFRVASIVIRHVLEGVLAHDRGRGRLWLSCRSVPISAVRIDDWPGPARAGRFWRDEEEIVRKETTDVD